MRSRSRQPKSPRALNRRSAAAAIVALFLASCRVAAPEERTLLDFFRFARLADRTRLAKLATVTFDPRTQGSVRSFVVTKIAPPRRAESIDAANTDRALVAASLTPRGKAPVDPTALTLAVEVEDVTIDASLRRPDGLLTSTPLAITLERAIDLTSGAPSVGRWIVTGLREQASVGR